MSASSQSRRLDLPPGRTAGLRESRGVRVQVIKGALWLTQEGDGRDLFFNDGEQFTIERDGVTVLHALEPTELQVESSATVLTRAPWWLRLIRGAASYFAAIGMNRAITRGIYRL